MREWKRTPRDFLGVPTTSLAFAGQAWPQRQTTSTGTSRINDLGRLMHDFCESDPDAMSTPLLAERVRCFKRTPKGVAQMCQIIDEICQEGIE